VENGVETDLFTPEGAANSVRSELGLEGKFLVSYIGTLGLAHGLQSIVQAASQLQNALPYVQFLFVGEGADKERLHTLVSELHLTNVHFMSQQPRHNIPSIIRASDVCLVLLRKAAVFETVIPTKMLEFMACARPVILGVGGQARQVIETAKAGICIEPEDPRALVDAVTQLYGDAQLRRGLGRNGREYIIENLSRKRTATAYVDVLENVIRNGRQENEIASDLEVGDIDYRGESSSTTDVRSPH
jgi:glycosyltransferase involved in cell wall biosynthesis